MSVPNGLAQPSGVRLAAGWLILLCAVATALFGFIQLGTALDTAERYGTSGVRNALMILGGAGGGIAVGITFLIWEFSVRLAKSTE